MVKKRVEIIDVTLGINVAEEIKMKVDSLSSEVIEHTKELVKKSGMKIQRNSKKQQANNERSEKIQIVTAFLEESFEVLDRWCDGKKLLEAAGIEVSPQNLNKLSMQIRKFLQKEDKWALSKKRRSGSTAYRLTRFS